MPRPKNGSGKSSSSNGTSSKERSGEQASIVRELARRVVLKERKHSQLLGQELNARKVDLIKVDLQTASTFVKIAQQAGGDREKMLRNREHARRGHDTVVHFLTTAKVERSEREEIEQQIGRLRIALEELGESFA